MHLVAPMSSSFQPLAVLDTNINSARAEKMESKKKNSGIPMRSSLSRPISTDRPPTKAIDVKPESVQTVQESGQPTDKNPTNAKPNDENPQSSTKVVPEPLFRINADSSGVTSTHSPRSSRKRTTRSERTLTRPRSPSGSKKKEPSVSAQTSDSTALLAFSSKQAELVQASEANESKTDEDEEAESNTIKAFVRMKPIDPKEINLPQCISIDPEGEDGLNSLAISDPRMSVATKEFKFNGIFDDTTENGHIYDTACKPLVDAVMNGFNGTLFAYGQTGTGKTHTMGSMATYSNTGGYQSASRGMIPMVIADLFDRIHQDTKHEYKVIFSYVQIYQEEVYDLLCEDAKCSEALAIREQPSKSVYIEGVSEFVVHSPAEITTLLTKGRRRLVVAETKMNRHSSRSHALCILSVERLLENNKKSNDPSLPNRDLLVKGKITLCDLAGSERIKRTESTGERLAEAQCINTSLHELGNVVHALADPDHSHVPFRNSVLTRLLQESLGGNCKTSLIVCCSSLMKDQSETKGTLLFGQRAMCVVQNARINVELDYRHLANELAQQLESQRELGSRLEAKLKRKATSLEKEVEKLKQDNAALVENLRTKHKHELDEAHSLHKSASKTSVSHQRQVAALQRQLASKTAEFETTEKKMKEMMKQQALRTAKEMAQRRNGRKEMTKLSEEQLTSAKNENELLRQLVVELEDNISVLQTEVENVVVVETKAREQAIEHVVEEQTNLMTSEKLKWEGEKKELESTLQETHAAEIKALNAIVEQLQSQVSAHSTRRDNACTIDTQTAAVELNTSDVQTDAVVTVCALQQTETVPLIDVSQQTEPSPKTAELEIQVDVDDLKQNGIRPSLPNEIDESFTDDATPDVGRSTQVDSGLSSPTRVIPTVEDSKEKKKKKKCLGFC
eukprot:m.125350 g.125350  ORF g.125350 m.125350 type:complete len:907 (-) comp29127_c1_seq4:117-2837(-)